jgi:hypothetical protein
VGRSEAAPQSYNVNVPYNLNLGPGSWPALVEIVGRTPVDRTKTELILGLRERARLERIRLAALEWRGQQWRRDRNAAALIAWAAPFGELTAEEMQSSSIRDMHSTERILRYGDPNSQGTPVP